jgi:D-xylose 1-dehydrogenase (NADP+, D-xylono-1,5-lactone-forming)
MARVRWGVLSTASIGRLVIEATRAADHAEFVAVASRDADRARAFTDELGLEASYGSYEELLASEAVDAVYVPLPVALHTEWTIKALAAGKDVLCEKPLATSAADAARCFDAAEAAGRHCVEGLMYRHHPQTTLARKLVADGAIGRLAYVRAALTVSVPPDDIRRSPALGGGVLRSSYRAFARGLRRSGRRCIGSWGRRCCSMEARRTFNGAPPTEPAKDDPDHSRLARQ